MTKAAALASPTVLPVGGRLVDTACGQDAAKPAADSSSRLGVVARGNRAAVATVQEKATEAGLEMIRRGGNAADAAVAAALMLAVVDGHNSGLGGGCFIVARSADGTVTAIDGRETAPAAAHPKMYFRDGAADSRISQTGPLASGVPGAVAAYHELSRRLGTGKWRQAASMAADVAAEGFAIDDGMARRLDLVADEMARYEGSRAVYFGEDGRPLGGGETLVQTDLAETLSEIANDGPDAFYKGRFAELTDAWMRSHGGLITAGDLAGYECRLRQPVRSGFRGHDVIGFPPPSSGGVHVAQILGLLERFDLKSLAAESPATYYHLVGEAMRLAFADRAVYLGDPDFANVPRGLVDPAYLADRSKRLHPKRRIDSVAAGDPPNSEKHGYFGGKDERHTTHLTAADAEGNWVAITATINTSFGSKVVIPGTGVVLNNEMDDFSIAPGVPNAFGLVGTEANAPAPGKRPLSSMSPTIVLKGGRPVVTCGAAGGPRIISATAQILLRHLACGAPIEQAIAAPRVHHQWRPDQLLVEPAVGAAVIEQLQAMGHTLKTNSAIATAQALALQRDGTLVAAGEPRLPGFAGAL